MEKFTLGIDIGTTSVKVCVKSGTNTMTSSRKIHHAYERTKLKSDCTSNCFREQDPAVLMTVLDQCMMEISENTKYNISSLAVTGQMHGVVLWKPKMMEIIKDVDCFISIMENSIQEHSNLITWEDQRCSDQFLKSLTPSPSGSNVATGYGQATLLWLHRDSQLDGYTMCGTIMDFVVWLLTQSKHVLMTNHNAKSWGYFDEGQQKWENEM